MKFIPVVLLLFAGSVGANTPVIRACTEIAEFIESAVINRDAGLTLEKALDLATLTTPEDSLPLAQSLIRAVYDDESLTPDKAFTETFIGCLEVQQRM